MNDSSFSVASVVHLSRFTFSEAEILRKKGGNIYVINY